MDLSRYLLCCGVLLAVAGCTATEGRIVSHGERQSLEQVIATRRSATSKSALPTGALVRFQSGDPTLWTPDVGASYWEVADDEQLFLVPELAIDLVDVEMTGCGESGNWFSGPTGAAAQVASLLSEIGTDIGNDYCNFYSYRNLPGFVALIGLGAYMANTDVDQNILEHVQDNITFHKNDEYQEFVEEYRFFGEGQFLLPFYACTAVVGKHMLSDYEAALRIGQWADRSLRGIFVGAPPLLLAQYIIGASRPGEIDEGSEWQFFADSNGVSGHAFMGAIPFITAAQMSADPFAKSLIYVVSALPALSRVTENDHYPSQAILGWSLAYVACRSVSRTESGPAGIQVEPWFTHSGVGLGLSFRR